MAPDPARRYLPGMTIAERIYHELAGRLGAGLCDDCLAKAAAVSQRQTVNTVTGAFALTRDFEKDTGRCAHCANEKLVTRCVHA